MDLLNIFKRKYIQQCEDNCIISYHTFVIILQIKNQINTFLTIDST